MMRMLRYFCFCQRKVPKKPSSNPLHREVPKIKPNSNPLYHEVPKIARARHRMEYVTGSQMAILRQGLGMHTGGVGGKGDHDPSLLLDQLLVWRMERGDFQDDDEEEDQAGFAGDEVPQLTSDMQDVSETTLNLGFLKSDLQLECLLRNIAYEGSDDKAKLISKLMDYQQTLILKSNTWQMLEDESNSAFGV